MRARNVLLFLLMFLGIGAIFGGAMLVISPDGALFGMPLSILMYSPFKNFLYPGIILLTVLGIAPIGLAFALLHKPRSKIAEKLNVYKDMYWGWTYTVYITFALVIWIQTEMFFMRAVHWAHSLYMLISLLIFFVLLLPQVRRAYKRYS